MFCAICAALIVLGGLSTWYAYQRGQRVGEKNFAICFVCTFVEMAQQGESLRVWDDDACWRFIPIECNPDDVPEHEPGTYGCQFDKPDQEIAF
jgi:hypothetical protein